MVVVGVTGVVGTGAGAAHISWLMGVIGIGAGAAHMSEFAVIGLIGVVNVVVVGDCEGVVDVVIVFVVGVERG